MAADGALKHDGAMGATFVALGDRVPASSAAVFGSEAKIRPEITGLTMALEECPVQEDLTLCAAVRLGILYTMRERNINELNM